MIESVDADEAQLAAARRGDATAFDDLVRRHTRTMYRVAVRILSDPVEAEDAVQDAWVSAWRSLSTFRGDSKVSTWLYRVVTNAALAQLRRRKLTVPLDPADDAVAGVLSDHNVGNPENHALRSEEAQRVHRAIATLEPSQRVPLILHELEGMSYEDVAEVLEVNVAALRSRLHRARAALLYRLKEMR